MNTALSNVLETNSKVKFAIGLHTILYNSFRIHTETGNIWTHFLGMILVVFAMLFIYMRPSASLADFPKGWQEILVFAAFFFGAFMCLMFSWLFHTCSCHSKETAKLFSK